jgi:hypothetical protein
MRFSPQRGKLLGLDPFLKRIYFMVFPYPKGFHNNKGYFMYCSLDIFWLFFN